MPAAVGMALTIVVITALLTVPNFLTARQAQEQPKEEPISRITQLPIGRVVLFSSGVGYFQREGKVEGDVVWVGCLL